MAKNGLKKQDVLKEGVRSKTPRFVFFGLFFILGSVVTSFLFLFCESNHSEVLAKTPQIRSLSLSEIEADIPKIQNANSSPNLTTQGKIRPTIENLLVMTPEELEKVDIAVMSLVCAEGLRGSEDLNIDQCLSILDQWTELLRKDIEKRLPIFPQYAAKYDNSINLFKVANMVLFLKNVIGVDYNQEIMKRETYPDSKDVFILGCLTHNKKGGCVSIPTICVALGRRLGYPLKLVATREHLFFRWDDGNEVFNMEVCCPGCDNRSDDYYRVFPKKISEKEVKYNGFLRSMTPIEELAIFLEVRAQCLFDMGNSAEAQMYFVYAYKKAPAMYRQGNIGRCINAEVEKIQKKYQE